MVFDVFQERVLGMISRTRVRRTLKKPCSSNPEGRGTRKFKIPQSPGHPPALTTPSFLSKATRPHTPTDCHSERSEESLCHDRYDSAYVRVRGLPQSSLSIRTGGTWLRNYSRLRPTQHHREILRFAQNDNKRSWRFYFKIDGDSYYLLDIMPHPK